MLRIPKIIFSQVGSNTLSGNKKVVQLQGGSNYYTQGLPTANKH